MLARSLRARLRALASTPLVTALVASAPQRGKADTYVDTPALGRTIASFAALGGGPVGERPGPLAGGGSELAVGFAWESGFSVAGIVGAARWGSQGPLVQTLGDAALGEGWAGVSFHHALGGAVAPFYGAALALDVVRGARDLSGPSASARIGLRVRERPFSFFGALEARRAWVSAPDGAGVAYTRLCVVLGVELEGPTR